MNFLIFDSSLFFDRHFLVQIASINLLIDIFGCRCRLHRICLSEESEKFRSESYYEGPFCLQIYDKQAYDAQKNPEIKGIVGTPYRLRIFSTKSYRKNIMEQNIIQINKYIYIYQKNMIWANSNPSVRPWEGKRLEYSFVIMEKIPSISLWKENIIISIKSFHFDLRSGFSNSDCQVRKI